MSTAKQIDLSSSKSKKFGTVKKQVIDKVKEKIVYLLDER